MKKQHRLQIVADLYKKGYSVRKIAELAQQRMASEKAISAQTIRADIALLVEEWRRQRMGNIDAAIQLELERIDMAITELWEAWEKSKTDYQQHSAKQKGKISVSKKEKEQISLFDDETFISLTDTEQATRDVKEYGNPRYISEIRYQLMERRKLLGLYATERNLTNAKNSEPPTPIGRMVNLDDFTEVEKKQLLLIARKIEN
ncbi:MULTISPECIES: hypothetical protein [unclassified Arcicella]|uniref:hypothetical protein n=1 Tax=unclassified Arcicella TaxID=2644986 RepID=UPI002855F43B|nr:MULTISPECIES: hypothetical protein [unclassified Arcicella]MDR6564665.1 vacuolar-type H+-ATPase subunit I/STV1 [Arcicella sp. BE51]MDR6814407.1 vacuolar-type H+-ATPase subunit I/STV1 [Arcicella sp. BE140]MDR6825837.1 vacuolar-type H+-ATPase subunit I/STV1 [Arcicella sp. BE139]